MAAVHQTEASPPYEDVPALPQAKPSSTMAVEGLPLDWPHISSLHYISNTMASCIILLLYCPLISYLGKFATTIYFF